MNIARGRGSDKMWQERDFQPILVYKNGHLRIQAFALSGVAPFHFHVVQLAGVSCKHTQTSSRVICRGTPDPKTCPASLPAKQWSMAEFPFSDNTVLMAAFNKPGRQGKFTRRQDLVIAREVAASEGYISEYGETGNFMRLKQYKLAWIPVWAYASHRRPYRPATNDSRINMIRLIRTIYVFLE